MCPMLLLLHWMAVALGSNGGWCCVLHCSFSSTMTWLAQTTTVRSEPLITDHSFPYKWSMVGCTCTREASGLSRECPNTCSIYDGVGHISPHYLTSRKDMILPPLLSFGPARARYEFDPANTSDGYVVFLILPLEREITTTSFPTCTVLSVGHTNVLLACLQQPVSVLGCSASTDVF